MFVIFYQKSKPAERLQTADQDSWESTGHLENCMLHFLPPHNGIFQQPKKSYIRVVPPPIKKYPLNGIANTGHSSYYRHRGTLVL
jgi:hypothetical protein